MRKTIQMERIAGFVLAMVMVLAMTVTAYAATIQIAGGAEGAVYSAYQLLHATDGGEGKFAYTLNEKYTAILQGVTGKATQEEVVAYIEMLDSEGIRTFADVVYERIKTASLTAEYTTDKDVFSEVKQGYYLIAETALGNTGDGATDAYSLVMLSTAGKENITINTKEGVPTVSKTVQEKNDSEGTTGDGQVSADYDIGDEIEFTLTGTVSGQIANYEKYYYEFADRMENMTYVHDSVQILVDGTDKTEDFTTVWNEVDKKLTISCADIKDLGLTLTDASKIVVTYKAALDSTAVSGTQGNKNSVSVKYSNDPYNYQDGNGDYVTGDTPVDTTVIFTYNAIVNKVDGDGNALEGAGFTLYKFNGTEYVKLGEELRGSTTFEFKGLDAGKYKLSETTVPAGYNRVEDIEFEVVSVITGDPGALEKLEVKDTNGNTIGTSDTSVDATNHIFTIQLTNGELITNVENRAGSMLPETGGRGTRIFYMAGAMLILGTAVICIVRRRMNHKE